MKVVEVTSTEQKTRYYLGTLEKMLARIRTEGLIHKNGHIREECDG